MLSSDYDLYDDPLVVVSGQSNLCHTFCHNIVSLRPQAVKLHEVCCIVPKTILVVVDCQSAFHDALFLTPLHFFPPFPTHPAFPKRPSQNSLLHMSSYSSRTYIALDPDTRPWLSFFRTLRLSSVPEPSCSFSVARPDGPPGTTTCRTSWERPIGCPRKSPRCTRSANRTWAPSRNPRWTHRAGSVCSGVPWTASSLPKPVGNYRR